MVLRADDENGEYVTVATVSGTDTEFADTGLSAGENYYYKVVAVYEGGAVASSASAGITFPYDPHSINAEFSITANPTPGGRWTLGYSTVAGVDFSPVTFFYPDSETDDGTLVPAWQLAAGRSPAFWHNNLGRTLSAGGGAVSLQPGEFWISSGNDGYPEHYGVVRYTVLPGESGNYQVSANVRSFWMTPAFGDTGFHILHNGREIYGNYLPGDASIEIVRRLDLAVNDTIDFVVGRGADGLEDGSVLKLWATLQRMTEPDPASATWTGTASLPATRYAHTATPLPNGKVLIAGGDNGANLANAELYDPATGTFTATAPMPVAKSRHTATLLPNGKVLVAGGYNGAAMSSCALYDPPTGTWTATGPMIGTRYVHTATLLPNGKVLVAGGYRTAGINDAELYDPATETWSATGNMGMPRHYHSATLLPDGKVLVAGAYYSGSAEIYNPATGTWTATASMNQARYIHSATLLPNGKVLVAAGHSGSAPRNSAELYDLVAGTWALTGSLTTERYYHSANLLPASGKVLVTGGYNNGSLATAQVYDPIAGTWAATGTMSGARYFHTGTVLPSNGKVLVTGGYGTSTYLSTSEVYTP
jgi:WD40 repeat protein